jgi:D-alanyl-D-alanine carboxypeptidase
MRLSKIKLERKPKEVLKVAGYIVLILAILFGIFGFKKVIDGYLAWRATEDVYSKMLAEIPIDYSFLKPFRNWNVENLEIGAEAVISMEVRDNKSRILFEKNSKKLLPIASLSKLFSAYLFVENYDLNKEIKFSKKAIETEEEIGFFKPGEKFFVRGLLYSVLLESSNDATYALAEIAGEKTFIRLMNAEAQNLGLENSRFVDPIGLDPDYSWEKFNYSTAQDLANFLKFLLEKSEFDPRISLLLEITRTPEFYLYRSDGSFHHKVESTNKMLKDYQNLIVAGKTGYTPLAKECFILVIKHPKYEDGYIVNVILGSKNRLKDMKKLINWVKRAYIW